MWKEKAERRKRELENERFAYHDQKEKVSFKASPANTMSIRLMIFRITDVLPTMDCLIVDSSSASLPNC